MNADKNQTSSLTSRTTVGALIGMGGLGCPALELITSLWEELTVVSGPLTLHLFDLDIISTTNLNRQILFHPHHINQPKVDVAKNTIGEKQGKNGFIETHNISLNKSNLSSHLGRMHFILDCCDDPILKVDLCAFAKSQNIPLVYAGVNQKRGTVMSISKGSPCLECAFGNFTKENIISLSNSCQEQGILGIYAGLTACHQVDELFNILDPTKQSIQTQEHMLTSIGSSIRKIKVSNSETCSIGCRFQSSPLIDLRKFSCPECFLYAKLALEDLSSRSARLLFGTEKDMNQVRCSLEKEDFNTLLIRNEPLFEHFEIVTSVP